MSKSTTEFNEWLNEVALYDHHEVTALYEAVRQDIEGFDQFTCEPIGEQFIVKKKGVDLVLVLGSAKAKQSFLRTIEIDYCEGNDIEAYSSFHYQMSLAS